MEKTMIFTDSRLLLLVLLVFILNPFHVQSWNISEEEDLELERQLKLLNKPAMKTINTNYGDVYDCVDFYKQPAFDHPLLKNFTFERSTLLRIQRRGRVSSKNAQTRGLQEGCPLGTVPIKRITKEDLLREKSASKLIQSFAGVEPNTPEKHPGNPFDINKKVAMGRTKLGWGRFKGMLGTMSIWNPQCVEGQYSAARMKMISGSESIEVGWRVDPTFTSGDSLTRYYIRTDGKDQTRCFNTYCPGFVVTNTDNPIDTVAKDISKFGGPIYEIKLRIERDDKNALVLYVGNEDLQIGFWPADIFSASGGLGELATELEWGGEVYSATGTPKPPMGSGNYSVNDTNSCAFVSGILALDERGRREKDLELESLADSEYFQVRDIESIEWHAPRREHVILYGGTT